MISETCRFQQICENILTASQDIISTADRDGFQAHLHHKLESFAPTLMLYGTHNSGKSTLINALFVKEDLAKIGGIPETSEVQAYEYQGYTIYADMAAVAINVLVSGYELYQAHKQHQDMVEAKRQRVLSIKNKSDEVAYQVRDNLLHHVGDISNSAFTIPMKHHHNQLQQLFQHQKNLIDRKQSLQLIVANL